MCTILKQDVIMMERRALKFRRYRLLLMKTSWKARSTGWQNTLSEGLRQEEDLTDFKVELCVWILDNNKLRV